MEEFKEEKGNTINTALIISNGDLWRACTWELEKLGMLLNGKTNATVNKTKVFLACF